MEALLSRGVPDGKLHAAAVDVDPFREIRRLDRGRLRVAEDVVDVAQQERRLPHATFSQENNLCFFFICGGEVFLWRTSTVRAIQYA